MCGAPDHLPVAWMRGAIFLGFMGCVFFVLCALGVWQLQRLAWKQGLIAQIEARSGASAIAAPGPADWPQLDLAGADYTRVALCGRFLPGALYYYTSLGTPRGPYGGPGVLTYSLFRAEQGWAVLVNRGFVPMRVRPFQPAPHEAPPTGSLCLEGLLRGPEAGSPFSPPPDVDRLIWYVRSHAQMADHLLAMGAGGAPPGALRAADIAPFSIDGETMSPPAAGALPQMGETIVDLPNNHLGYAVTWFGLAAVVLGMSVFYLYRLYRQ